MDPSGELLYLSQPDIERSNVRIKEILEVVEEAFRKKLPAEPKPFQAGIHPRLDAFIHAMPACHSKNERYRNEMWEKSLRAQNLVGKTWKNESWL